MPVVSFALAFAVTPGAIGAFVDERRDELIDLACALVAARTPSPPGDETAGANIVVERLRVLGIDHVAVLAAEPTRPNVIARIPGRGGGPTLILNGHLDTKPPGDLAAWRTDPWQPTISSDRLAGLGSADMKGAVAAMAYAGLAVAETGARGTLVLAFTADEESGGVYGPKWLAESALLEADACLIGEPCGIRDDWEAIRLVSRGSAIFTIRVRGTQMHSSLSDQLDSVNATVEMARLMVTMADAGNRFLAYEPHSLVERGPTVNVGLTATAGCGYGILAGQAEFLSDIRAIPGMTITGIEADVRSLLEAAMSEQAGLDAEFRLEHWTPPSEISADHEIVRALQAAAGDVLGRSVPLGGFPGGTDAPHFESAGIPTVPSFGPGLLTVAHTPNESISVDSLVEAAKIYALASLRYLDA
jgi:acetylornithine deacetylase/succinyl-diaminopimelate desuccinylase-like protein